MNNGDTIVAIPIPKPPIKRENVSPMNVSDNTQPITEMIASTAEMTSGFLRPILSAITPEHIDPMKHPASADDTNQPVSPADNSNFAVT
ncbi:hypothetical protein D3C84_989710 [compost metagenome]